MVKSILNKNKEFDFIADIINDVGLEQLDNLNSLINKYKVVEDKVSVKKMIKMIGERDNFLENKKISLSTMLRTMGYQESTIKKTVKNEIELTKNDEALSSIKSISRVLILIQSYFKNLKITNR